jgi:hypothetical protein
MRADPSSRFRPLFDREAIEPSPRGVVSPPRAARSGEEAARHARSECPGDQISSGGSCGRDRARSDGPERCSVARAALTGALLVSEDLDDYVSVLRRVARSIPAVLNGIASVPLLSSAIRPPLSGPPISATLSIASCAAFSTFMCAYSIAAATR